MILVVGLGNPGKKYANTRHNLGFRVIDEFAKKNNFPDFKLSKKFLAEISKSSFNNQKIILAKPQTFMNLSEKAVKLLIENCKLKVENLFVVHDEIDLPLGKIRISKGRGAAGHKGVESIIKELKTKKFVRFRIGIQPANNEQRTANKTEKFVLGKFTKQEENIVKEVIKKTAEAIEMAIKEGLEKAISKYNCLSIIAN